jgi:hypothetical protein
MLSAEFLIFFSDGRRLIPRRRTRFRASPAPIQLEVLWNRCAIFPLVAG